MISETETYPPHKSFLSAIWLWLRVFSYGVLGQRVYYEEAEDVYAPLRSYTVNRAYRHLHHYHAQRALPPVRNLTPFRCFGRRAVTPTQFLERRCRLSCTGRIEVYRIIYYAHRLVREAFMARFEAGVFRMPHGLCDAHIAPD